MAGEASRPGLKKRVGEYLQFRLTASKLFKFRTPGKILFFPGCSLASADPELTAQAYFLIKKNYPELGIWFDCCGMPLKMFVSSKSAGNQMEKLVHFLKISGITEVITACGNCFNRFSLAAKRVSGFKVTPWFDCLPVEPRPGEHAGNYVFHSTCASRKNSRLQKSFHRLAERSGIQKENENFICTRPACCLTPNHVSAEMKLKFKGKTLLTTCANCVKNFQSDFESKHIIQLLLGSDRKWRRMDLIQKFRNYKRLKMLTVKPVRNAM